ncbi:transcriptional regulator [Methylobacterium sp. Leaf104]|uniref:response regulator n=1 Tax=Methylobacterium TaxID=407 RepID=UPI0006F7DF02|nr:MULTISPECIES: response regulator [Methylobacterium]KQP42951.1 transcriptional regulator [Methylobacterium sp. Leaf104]MCI9878433.1 response regulator [Methylobacterium goesingense]
MIDLGGRRVLLVEDESLVAMLGEDMLLDLGCEVEIAMRLDKAVALARGADIDMAILDVNLGETCSYPVADVLFERRIPFIFATGYGLAGIEPAYGAVPVMQKPYQIAQMERLLRHLVTCETLPTKAGGRPLACGCSPGAKTGGPQQMRAD